MSSNLPDVVSQTESVADKLTIDTPEQTSLDFLVAGIGSRFLAIALDTLIQIGLFLIAFLLGAFLVGLASSASPLAGLWGFAIVIFLFFMIYFGYFAVFEILWNGQTPGKRKIGIRVIKDSGRPLTPAEAIARNLLRIVDVLPIFYGIGAFSAVLSKQSKRLGDYVAGSLVVRESSFTELKPVWQAQQAPAELAVPSLGSSNLSTDDFVLIESYLNRRYEIDPDVRRRMASDILTRIKSHLTLPAESAMSTDDILESISRERRSNSRFG